MTIKEQIKFYVPNFNCQVGGLLVPNYMVVNFLQQEILILSYKVAEVLDNHMFRFITNILSGSTSGKMICMLSPQAGYSYQSTF